MVFAQSEKWNENTMDAACEAPNSKFQKEWYRTDESKETFQFRANGTFTYSGTTSLDFENEKMRYSIISTGNYTREKGHLHLISTKAQAKYNQADLDALSSRNRDLAIGAIKAFNSNLASSNVVFDYLILRLDDECLILMEYNPETKLFNDKVWSTFYNETHKKKETEAKAIREAEERAKLAEEARIKAENEYWARMGTEKKASADKAATEGVKLVDLGLSVRWADRNVGAKSPEDDGFFFRWGEITPLFSLSAKYKPVIKPKKGAVLNEESDPATVRWGVGFHVPTPQQWEELFSKCTFKLDSEKKVVIVKGPNGNTISIADSLYWTNAMSVDEKGKAQYVCVGEKPFIIEDDVQSPRGIRAVME